jgi:alkanesulfonate monooxygenase SsuD/methylene tetrahydromethanopterin reductase-like flavin-dependent oxidoreductase (luciferase family)
VPRLPSPPPIYLAGLGTAMLELAGEIADGAVLWLCAPAYVREHALPAIRRGRERAGKPLAGFEIVVSVPAAVTTDRAAGRELFKVELTRYLVLPFYRAMLEKSGFGPEVAAWDRTRDPATVADRLLEGLGAVGDAPALGRLVASYRDAGVTLPAIRPIGFPDAPHYLPTLEVGSAF